MNDVRDQPIEITLGEKTFFVVLNLNVLADIQDRYGRVDDIQSKMQEFKEIRFILTALINGSSDESVTERWVGKQLNLNNLKEVTNKVYDSFLLSIPKVDEYTEPDPNQTPE